MSGLADFYFGILLFVGYSLPFVLVAWLVEIWWVNLPYFKRIRYARRFGKWF